MRREDERTTSDICLQNILCFPASLIQICLLLPCCRTNVGIFITFQHSKGKAKGKSYFKQLARVSIHKSKSLSSSSTRDGMSHFRMPVTHTQTQSFLPLQKEGFWSEDRENEKPIFCLLECDVSPSLEQRWCQNIRPDVMCSHLLPVATPTSLSLLLSFPSEGTFASFFRSSKKLIHLTSKRRLRDGGREPDEERKGTIKDPSFSPSDVTSSSLLTL